MQAKTVIFMGPQGSGKGTQARILEKHLDEIDQGRKVFYVESGQRFRNLMEGNSYTARKIKDSVNRGDLQPDWLPTWVLVSEFF